MNFKLPAIATCFLALTVMVSGPALAREAPRPPVCTPAGEAIVTLNVPSFGTPTVWDVQFGDQANQTMIQFAGGVQLEGGNILAAGVEQDINFRPVNTVLVELDKRSKTITDKRVPAGKSEQQSGMIGLGDGSYIIASTIMGGKAPEQKWTRLARYDHDLTFKSEIILKDNVFDYEAGSITPLAKGKGYVVVVHAINRKDINDEYSILFRIGANGKVIWKRAYRPGIANQIYSVAAVDDRHMIAGGRVRNEDGRMVGWLMLLNDDGTIVWQNTMPRGKTAMVRAMAVKTGLLDGDHYMAVGQVVPYGSDPTAVWLTELDSAGNVLWQRYIRATNYNLDGRAVLVEPDGRVSVMANAIVKTGEEDGSNHIRLITLSPRGDLMNDDAYMQGRRADAAQIIPGSGRERIVIASIDAKVADEGKENELIIASMARKTHVGPDLPVKEDEPTADKNPAIDILRRQGWVFAATPLPPYRDPCIIPSESAAP